MRDRPRSRFLPMRTDPWPILAVMPPPSRSARPPTARGAASCYELTSSTRRSRSRRGTRSAVVLPEFAAPWRLRSRSRRIRRGRALHQCGSSCTACFRCRAAARRACATSAWELDSGHELMFGVPMVRSAAHGRGRRISVGTAALDAEVWRASARAAARSARPGAVMCAFLRALRASRDPGLGAGRPADPARPGPRRSRCGDHRSGRRRVEVAPADGTRRVHAELERQRNDDTHRPAARVSTVCSMAVVAARQRWVALVRRPPAAPVSRNVSAVA